MRYARNLLRLIALLPIGMVAGVLNLHYKFHHSWAQTILDWEDSLGEKLRALKWMNIEYKKKGK